MVDNKKSAVPLYVQIKNHIKEQLDNKVYNVGDILPTELEYQKQFNVSRITVRNAINELVKEGYLTRTRGKGTTVCFKKLNETISHSRSFTEEMASLGLEAVTKSVNLSIIKADSFIADYLGVKEEDYALRIERVRGTRDYPVVYFDSYFSIDRRLPIDKDLYTGSLYNIYRKYLDIDWKTDIIRFADRFEAVRADSNMAGLLETKVGSPLLKRLSQTCDKEGKIFEFTICYYRGDEYSCTISYN